MTRKTIHVDALVNRANALLRNSTADKGIRMGVIALLENVLHETGSYRGFGYLRQHEVPEGELPGVQWPTLPEEDNPHATYPDDTRRFYYGGRIGA